MKKRNSKWEREGNSLDDLSMGDVTLCSLAAPFKPIEKAPTQSAIRISFKVQMKLTSKSPWTTYYVLTMIGNGSFLLFNSSPRTVHLPRPQCGSLEPSRTDLNSSREVYITRSLEFRRPPRHHARLPSFLQTSRSGSNVIITLEVGSCKNNDLIYHSCKHGAMGMKEVTKSSPG